MISSVDFEQVLIAGLTFDQYLRRTAITFIKTWNLLFKSTIETLELGLKSV